MMHLVNLAALSHNTAQQLLIPINPGARLLALRRERLKLTRTRDNAKSVQILEALNY